MRTTPILLGHRVAASRGGSSKPSSAGRRQLAAEWLEAIQEGSQLLPSARPARRAGGHRGVMGRGGPSGRSLLRTWRHVCFPVLVLRRSESWWGLPALPAVTTSLPLVLCPLDRIRDGEGKKDNSGIRQDKAESRNQRESSAEHQGKKHSSVFILCHEEMDSSCHDLCAVQGIASSLTLLFFPLLSRPCGRLHLFPPPELRSRLGMALLPSPCPAEAGVSHWLGETHQHPGSWDPWSGTTCHLQKWTPPITANETSLFPISSSDPARARRVGAIGRGGRGAGDRDRAEPSRSPALAQLEEPGVGGGGDPPHSLGDTSKKHLFLAQVVSWSESLRCGCLTFKEGGLERWKEQKSLKDYLFLMNYI